MMVSWVELLATTLVMEGAIGPGVIERLKLYLRYINHMDLLKEAVGTVMLVGLLTRPTTLLSMTWMV